MCIAISSALPNFGENVQGIKTIVTCMKAVKLNKPRQRTQNLILDTIKCETDTWIGISHGHGFRSVQPRVCGLNDITCKWR